MLFEYYFLKYERIQKEERAVLRHMYTLQSQSRGLKNSDRKTKYSSDSIVIDQFEELQRRNRRLEHERRRKYLSCILLTEECFLFLRYSEETRRFDRYSLSTSTHGIL